MEEAAGTLRARPALSATLTDPNYPPTMEVGEPTIVELNLNTVTIVYKDAF